MPLTYVAAISPSLSLDVLSKMLRVWIFLGSSGKMVMGLKGERFFDDPGKRMEGENVGFLHPWGFGLEG